MGVRRVSAWLGAALVALPGCSFVLVRGPGPADARGVPDRSGCTTEEYAPVLDSIFAGLYALAGTAAAVGAAQPAPMPPPGDPPRENDDAIALGVVAGIALTGTVVQLSSGIYGFATTASCRSAYGASGPEVALPDRAAPGPAVTLAESGATARAHVSSEPCAEDPSTAADRSAGARSDVLEPGAERVTFEVVANCPLTLGPGNLVVEVTVTNPGPNSTTFPLDLARIGVGATGGGARALAVRGRLSREMALTFLGADRALPQLIPAGAAYTFVILLEGAQPGDELRLAPGLLATIEPERSTPVAPAVAPAPMGPPPLAVEREQTGRAIPLENGLTLTLETTPIRDETIYSDASTDSFTRGLEVTLELENAGAGAVESSIFALLEGYDTALLRYESLDGGADEVVAAIAMELVGSGFGYRRTSRPGGIGAHGTCLDNDPVGVSDARGQHLGLVVRLCTAPNEVDRVHLMFPRPRAASRAILEIRSCDGCPDGGLAIDLGTFDPTAAPTP